MDVDTARAFVLRQAGVAEPERTDTFLYRLRQGQPPVPGQVTSLLLALKVLFEGLKTETHLERPLAAALFLLAHDSRRQFIAGTQAGVSWPPLLSDDLARIAQAVEAILLNRRVD